MTEFVKDKDCLVCGPGVLIELDSSITLQKVSYLAYATSRNYMLYAVLQTHHCIHLVFGCCCVSKFQILRNLVNPS